MDFDLRHLFVFQDLMQSRNVSATAEALAMPQSSVSRSLSKMREHFGDELFVRTRGGMRPTPHALELQPVIEQMLSLYNDRLLQASSFEPGTSVRSFRISASDIGLALFIPRLCQIIEEVAPQVSLQGVPLGLNGLAEDLETGKIDVAIGSFPKLVAGIYERTIFKERYVCVVRADHPVVGKRLTQRQFKDMQHIVVSTKGLGHIHSQVEQEIKAKCRKEQIRVVSYNFLSSVLIAMQTDYVVTVPSMVVKVLGDNGLFRVFDPPIALPSFAVKAYWHERFHKEPSNRWIRALIADCFPR